MSDYKSTVRWLWRYQGCLRQEQELALEVERLRAEAERITPLLTGMPGGINTDKLSCAVERIQPAFCFDDGGALSKTFFIETIDLK